MTQTPSREWRTDLKATPKGSVLDYWLGGYAEVESRMKCLEREVNRLKEALKEAKGDFEYIQSWQEIPETLQTWVKTAIKAREEELSNSVFRHSSTLYPDTPAPAAPTPGITARPIEEWHEDYGDALWWTFPIQEPPYCGSPLDVDWPDYHTHWTPLVLSAAPKEGE